MAVFLLGIKKYKKEGPSGSPFTRLAQVFVAAARKWRVKYTPDNNKHCNEELPNIIVPKLLHTDEYRLLDKAMIIDEVDARRERRDPWRLCSVTQVEEVKLVVRLIPIWLSCVMFNVIQAQNHTYFVKQGDTMFRSIGPNFLVPPAVIQGLVGIIILFAVPIYDRVFIPLARKFTGHPTGITVLQRIGVGNFLSILTMVIAALVESKRVTIATNHGLLNNPEAVIPMRIWWLLPQYIVTGVSDAFTVVGLQELFYDQMPEGMRSMGAALYISLVGVGNFVGIAIIDIVVKITSKNSGGSWLGTNINRAHLDYYYWVLAVLSAISCCVYLWLAKVYEYKKVDINQQITSAEDNHNLQV
ncbi:putative proton-dependent oligopeptide transporter family, major facilitator superfamily [Lupinus albus]|uniref:Putative proton-dependent oligopeptide transporter family, major facilitator superfamily n=1 Tax=Lupinus albus TaxID=3870 RepID=A0A6A4R4A2_LUPAL|nr:putative proton-dependent oligopeptide transporter family, major facilitator superfamily [Lupinus albus]